MRRRLATSFLAVLCLGALAASPASAAFGLKEADLTVVGQDGAAAVQAGSHPFSVTTSLAFLTSPTSIPGLGAELPDGAVKDLKVGLPAGFVGRPAAVPTCPSALFLASQLGNPSCPPSTQVGYTDVVSGGPPTSTREPVYNLVPPPGVAAKIGFKALTVPITVELGVNPNPPYNIVAQVNNTPNVIPFFGSSVTIWGVPAITPTTPNAPVAPPAAAARSTCPPNPSSPCRALAPGRWPPSLKSTPGKTPAPGSPKPPSARNRAAAATSASVPRSRPSRRPSPPSPRPAWTSPSTSRTKV